MLSNCDCLFSYIRFKACRLLRLQVTGRRCAQAALGARLIWTSIQLIIRVYLRACGAGLGLTRHR